MSQEDCVSQPAPTSHESQPSELARRPRGAVALAALVARSSGLRFDGFVTHPAPRGARDFLEEAVVRAEREGLPVRTVSASGTPTMWDSEALRPVVTEYRVGTYAFYDRNSVAAGAAALDDVALTVHATVVSRPAPDRALLDAGSKALASEPPLDASLGLILEAPGSPIVRLDEEHAYVSLAPDEALELGQPVRIVPTHACVVANLFDELVVVRGEETVGRWKVDARGRST